MKTPHRMMYDALSSVNYRRILLNMELTGRVEGFHNAPNAGRVLLLAFDWKTTPEGYRYWERVWHDLKN